MSNFTQYVEAGNANLVSTSSSSKLTEHLRTFKSVPKYYWGNFKKIKRGAKGALKTIKKLPTGEFQLKIQLGKFAHPLIEKDGEKYPTANFGTKDEALDAFEGWIEDLENEEPEIVGVVYPAWEEYAKANEIPYSAWEEYAKANGIPIPGKGVSK